MRQPIVFHVRMEYQSTQHAIEEISRELNTKHKHIVDGYEFVFYVSGSNDVNCHGTTMECIYPVYVADEEMIKLQKENIKLLNCFLKDTLKTKDKEKESLLLKIFRKFKLERLNK